MVGVKRALALLVPCAALAISGCDLLEDATSFNVCTNWEKVSVDTAQIGLNAGGATVPDVPCTAGGADVCAQATAGISCSGGSYECKVQCGGSAKCEVEATAQAPAQTVDLSSKIQNSVQASALDKVTIDSVEYRVSANSLNFATPAISVYVGPNAATKVGDAGVTLFATLPPIPSKGTPSSSLSPTAAGQTALTGFVKNYKTPFKILSSATMTFQAGDSVPEGKLDAEIRTCFKISPL